MSHRASAPPRRSLLTFFVLLFALAVPFWVIGAVTRLQLTADLPLSALQFICPGLAAALLVYRENRSAGASALLRRSIDYHRITVRIWYAPILLLPPGIYGLSYGVMHVMGLPLPAPHFPLLAALATFLAFFVAALAEELGWSGYAIDPLQARWNALRASLLLGSLWAMFHAVPLLQAHRSLAWIAWWTLGTVSLRVLITWIYNNTGRSVFAATLFHALANLSQLGPFLNFGPGGYPYDAQRISGLLLTLAIVIVTGVWGQRTLARHGHR